MKSTTNIQIEAKVSLRYKGTWIAYKYIDYDKYFLAAVIITEVTDSSSFNISTKLLLK